MVELDFWQGVQSEDYWYNAIEKLGDGGNAVTYRAVRSVDTVDGDFANGAGVSYAVKLFDQTTDSGSERLEGFYEERDFLKETDHPSILSCHDSGEWNDHPFYVSDYMPRDLSNVIRGEPISFRKKVEYATQLLSALTYLANSDPPVVHRDIKPSNVLIKADSCVLADFGAMKFLGQDSSGTDTERERSEPAYPYYYRTPDIMSYERGEGELTSKSDVFQLGLILAELFTGRNPERTPDEEHPSVELEELNFIHGTRGGDVADLLDQMLTMDPSDRPDAEDLIRDWRQLLEQTTRQELELNGQVL
jgi:serine/threonine-protein kinase